MITFSELTEEFVETDLRTVLTLAGERETRSLIEYLDQCRMMVAVYSDGLEIAWQSECDGPYSEVTPDLSWQPPTVHVRNAKLGPPRSSRSH